MFRLKTLFAFSSRVGRLAGAESEGSQIVEFAVALPLLLVLVVGIFDFGNAYNLKQRITNVAREASRMGSSQPTNDLSNPSPASVIAIRDMVATSLQSSRVNNCGLGSAAAVAAGRLDSLEVDLHFLLWKRWQSGAYRRPRLRFHQYRSDRWYSRENTRNQRLHPVPLSMAIQSGYYPAGAHCHLSGHYADHRRFGDDEPELKEQK